MYKHLIHYSIYLLQAQAFKPKFYDKISTILLYDLHKLLRYALKHIIL